MKGCFLRARRKTAQDEHTELQRNMDRRSWCLASGGRRQAGATCGNAKQVASPRSQCHWQQKQLEPVRVGIIADPSSEP